jgi:dUTP pyrophosphatase
MLNRCSSILVPPIHLFKCESAINNLWDNMKVKIRRLDKELPLPEYHTGGAIAFDLYSRLTVSIPSHELSFIPLNVAIQIPEGYMILLAPRSSTPKKGIIFANSVGLMDRDYSGNNDEYKAFVYNYTNSSVTIKRGERIAQGIVLKSDIVEWEEVDDLGSPDRGGFGTTGD